MSSGVWLSAKPVADTAKKALDTVKAVRKEEIDRVAIRLEKREGARYKNEEEIREAALAKVLVSEGVDKLAEMVALEQLYALAEGAETLMKDSKVFVCAEDYYLIKDGVNS